MASKVSIGIVALVALSLCFMAMSDVPYNTAIRDLQPSIVVLRGLVGLIALAAALALNQGSRTTMVASFIASSLGILFSLMLACV